MSGSSLFPPTHERGLSVNLRNLTVPVAHDYSHRNSHRNSHDNSTCHTCYLSTAHPVRECSTQMRELPRLRRCDDSIALHISIYHAAGFLPSFAKYRSRCPFIARSMPYKLSSMKWPLSVRRPPICNSSFRAAGHARGVPGALAAKIESQKPWSNITHTVSVRFAGAVHAGVMTLLGR